MSEEQRIKYLYKKYIDRTCSDSELQELFDLLNDQKQYNSIRSVLRDRWEMKQDIHESFPLDWETFLKRTGQSKVKIAKTAKKKMRWMIPFSAAASLLCIIGLATWFWMNREVIVVYETGYGEVREIVLNDNSHVRLNANSKIYWDENWERKDHRKARIEGEAFFEVSHRDGNQFLVETSDLTVQVTGTRFNVASRRNETEVYLESGKVFLQLHEDKDESESGSDQEKSTLEMIPGDQLTYSKTTQEIEQLDKRTIEQAASWKTGSLIFKNIPLKDVLQELSDVYGKSFMVQDSSLFEKKIDAAYPYSDWKTVKGLLGLTLSADLTEIKNEVIIKK